MRVAFRDDIIAGFANTRWLGLTIFEHTWSEAENTGYVSFIARFSEQGKTGAIIERSRFIKENGQWYYIDGTRPLLGRNDPARAVQAKNLKSAAASDA